MGRHSEQGNLIVWLHLLLILRLFRLMDRFMSHYRNIVQNQSSETNLKNLDQLKHYNYSQEFRRNPKNGKMIIVYTWGYPECGKEFLRTWNLLDHVRMHCGIKPYVCHLWTKSFTQIGNMRKHVQQHFQSTQNQRRLSSELEASLMHQRSNFNVNLWMLD